MDLVERKQKLEEIVAHLKQGIEATFTKREELVAQMNGFLGQIHLIDQLLAEATDPPPPTELPEEPPEVPSDTELVAGEEQLPEE